MISPQAAQRLIRQHCPASRAVTVPIERALGYVLAEDVRATYPLPYFDNSAMDGFALRSTDTRHATPERPARLSIVDAIYAGDPTTRVVGRQQCCRIMTGGAMPRGADTVIPKEQAAIDGQRLVVNGPVDGSRHVRRCGEEVAKGDPILKRGSVIHPGVIACLAAAGKGKVKVKAKPRVAVITTGDEALPPGSRLSHGQIYDSNSFMVAAMLRQMGIESIRERHVKDHPTALANAIEAALRQSDVLILVGGVSVGDRDYIRSVLNRKRVREVFWRVRQKPGKPLYFGHRGKRLVFGLPGNPASAFTCFYLYVYPALRRIAGFRRTSLLERTAALQNETGGDEVKWLFLKGKADSPCGNDVTRLTRQGSHMITSLADADCLIEVPPGQHGVGPDGDVLTYRLPGVEEEE